MLDEDFVEITASRLWRRAHPFLYMYTLECPACGTREELPSVEPDVHQIPCSLCGEPVPVRAALPRLRGDGFWLFPAE
jgi:hypothetical protein